MTMDNDNSEEGQRRIAIVDLHSEVLRIALLRLNYLHEKMDIVQFQALLLLQPGHTLIQEEYDAIKERVEQRMPGFIVLYCNEAKSHCLVPVKEGGAL